MLDEPAASLDWGNRHRLMQRLECLAADGLGLILSTHEPDHARRLATRVLTLDADGRTWSGSPLVALHGDRLAKLYDLPLNGEDGMSERPVRPANYVAGP